MQKVVIQKITNCILCGKEARLYCSFDYWPEYRVECSNRYYRTKYCATANRAICRWNNRNKYNAETALQIKDNYVN